MRYYKHIRKPMVVQMDDEVIMNERYIEITKQEYDELINKLDSPFNIVLEPSGNE